MRGMALKWFESYLSDRKQFVSSNGVSPDIPDVKYGVPPRLCFRTFTVSHFHQ